jgi:hypothetical protein
LICDKIKEGRVLFSEKKKKEEELRRRRRNGGRGNEGLSSKL